MYSFRSENTNKYSDGNLGVKHTDYQHSGSNGDFEDDFKGVIMNRLRRRPGTDKVV